MEKAIQMALADEMLNTVIHKFQIPGSGTQLLVQGEAINILGAIFENNTELRFPGLRDLVEMVRQKMPACYGMVPDLFYQLRRYVEEVFNTDEDLQHVVNVSAVRGNRSDLHYLLPILKHPDIPPEFKEEQLDGGLFLMADSSTMDSVKAIIEVMADSEEKKKELIIQLAPAVDSAYVADKIKAIVETGNWEDLYGLDIDGNTMMELSARADAVLDPLFRHYLGKWYDRKE